MAESKKSNFSVTCSLLSQYLKRNRSFADLGVLEMAPRPQEPTKGLYRPPTTLNLLPGLEVSAENETGAEDAASVSGRNATKLIEPENAPLTIFYGGRVMIFDNFSPEKAADLMNLAATVPATPAGGHTVVNTVKLNTATDVPLQARRASLHRFFEKRKDRINSKAPYQMNSSSKMGPTNKPQDARSWLGLGQDISNFELDLKKIKGVENFHLFDKN